MTELEVIRGGDTPAHTEKRAQLLHSEDALRSLLCVSRRVPSANDLELGLAAEHQATRLDTDVELIRCKRARQFRAKDDGPGRFLQIVPIPTHNFYFGFDPIIDVVAISPAVVLEQLIGAASNRVLYFLLLVKQNIGGDKLHWNRDFASVWW